jgi:CBS domain-containing protein
MALSQQLSQTLREMTLVSLSPDNTVHFAARIMSEYRADVVALKRRGCVVGMLTLRDLAARVSALGRDPEVTALSAVMTAASAASMTGGIGMAGR